MIEKFDDLLEGLEKPESIEDLNKQIRDRVQEKLGLSFDELKQSLSDYVIANADEIATQFVNISPFGDYSKMLEEPDKMAKFLKTEGHKAENWVEEGLSPTESKDLITFRFSNKSVDDGDVFDGFVYVSFQGKIKHAFAQGNDN
jgi:hypothetical protein